MCKNWAVIFLIPSDNLTVCFWEIILREKVIHFVQNNNHVWIILSKLLSQNCYYDCYKLDSLNISV